ncbi:integrin alpha-6-like [Gouania willdenowi]|uniref:Integrin alpha-6-like n=1 Tax=Gouania willdenowi TaxID=441366 RepID=A0A8C5EV44_GOUWI|nr:integrin alpha-6-like [Gouania willdenowi]
MRCVCGCVWEENWKGGAAGSVQHPTNIQPSSQSAALSSNSSIVPMEVWNSRALCLFIFLFEFNRLSAFNLDVDNVLKKSGDPGSLFGFSLAMHRQLQPVDKRMLLVGAPKAGPIGGHQAKTPGGLYSCDISTSPGCTRVNFDNEFEDTRRESKENQWMGVTVNSQGPGGRVVTCAHRYQRRSNVGTDLETRDIIGRCYMLGQDLTISDKSREGEGGGWHFCDNRPGGHAMFGSCQQGLSATFDKDYHYLIFGAPGAYNWKGIVRLEQKNYTLYDLGIFDDGPFETGDDSKRKPELVPVPSSSYLGFSLDSGRSLTKKGQLTVVAGAPRAGHSGEVLLLKTGGDTSTILLKEYSLEGEGLASSFGYDLAVLDLNKDGWEDIVVGAPQYFEKDGEIGGAVYVFVNKAGKWNKVTPIRIAGPQDSMFGLSVENLGDINLDGYHDFAVGAPYDDDEGGNVFIYHGSDTGLSSEKAAQVLSGQPLGVKWFGYSLAGNMDLDENSYPDVAVGSLSDAVFIFRTRPVINIKKTIKFTPTKIDLNNKNCGNTFCLTVEACFTYTANPKSYAPRLALVYSMEADADLKKNGFIPRASFTEPGASEKTNEAKGIISINVKDKTVCVKRQLAIQENIKDKLHGIPIDVSVEINDATRKRRQSSNGPLKPVLDANEPPTTRSQVNFLKEGCGGDNVCESNLQVKHRFGHRSTDQDTFTPLELENGIPVISLSDQNNIALEIKVTNPDGDDAHEASINASFPRSLTYAAYRVSPQELSVSCIANKNGSRAHCDLGNPFKRDSETTFYIILGTSGISPDTSELEIELQLETTSNQKQIAPVKAKAKIAIVLQLSLSGQAQPSQIYFTGDIKGEAAMKSESDIGNPIIHQFRIINLGKRLADFGTATLNIDWPKETEKGKWLLYLMKISSMGVEMECTPKGEINPLTMGASSARSRRAAEKSKNKSKQGTLARLADGKNTKTLSCGKGAKCVRIKCPLRALDSNALITLNSRLWNSTFLEDYSKLHHTELAARAFLSFESLAKNILLQNAETEVKLTVFPERREAQSGGVPWWIIVLSILLFLLLLGLLFFLLWKCGVFGKKNKEEKEKLTPNA